MNKEFFGKLSEFFWHRFSAVLQGFLRKVVAERGFLMDKGW
jgi:hypothetical protein